MTQAPSQGAVVQIKPQPNVYTILLIVAIIAMGVTIGVVLHNLMADPPVGYGLTFGELFQSLKDLPGK